mmetsp:Transcript_45940/g.109392  ORF Transcript_45940/g.109392 Transcript_45940/m.109392 type:complete len:427 (-) Transcript_45940:189-1469(-)
MVKGLRPGVMGAQASMDLLKATLAERQAKSQQMLSELGNGKTWIRRGDLERQREEKYLEELRQDQEKQKAAEEARLEMEEQLMAKKKKDQEPEQKKVDIDMTLLDDDDAEPPIGAEEVGEQLRELGQPITLFGETDMMRYKRMRQLQREGLEGRRNPDEVMLEQLHSNKALALEDDAEDAAERRARKEQQEDEQEDAELDAEEAQESSSQKDSSEQTSEKDSEDEEQAAEGGGKSKDEPVASLDTKKEEMKVEVEVALMDRCDFIRGWIRKAIKAWEKELAERPEELKSKAQHKTEMAQHRQCRRDLKPLQKRLRVYALQNFYLDKIHTIVKFADEREYRSAAEAYLDLTIGKAAWPVGLGCGGSMLMEDAIGLHDRFNRNKQVSDNAEAFNDEVARKYGQAVKRLMGVAQKYWPPDDPSKAFGAA